MHLLPLSPQLVAGISSPAFLFGRERHSLSMTTSPVDPMTPPTRHVGAARNETSTAVIATLFGLGLLVVAFAMIGRLAGWADEHGTILVYLAFFVWMSIAGRVFWWGTDRVVATVRKPAAQDHR